MLNNRKLNIAIVDDHVLVRQGIIEALTRANDRLKFIVEADNGMDFIAQMENRTIAIDIVLMDLEMNTMDGFETITWLKSHFPEMKIIVIRWFKQNTKM